MSMDNGAELIEYLKNIEAKGENRLEWATMPEDEFLVRRQQAVAGIAEQIGKPVEIVAEALVLDKKKLVIFGHGVKEKTTAISSLISEVLEAKKAKHGRDYFTATAQSVINISDGKPESDIGEIMTMRWKTENVKDEKDNNTKSIEVTPIDHNNILTEAVDSLRTNLKLLGSVDMPAYSDSK